MASKTQNVQPNLKICIDNVDQTSEMEDGEVEESSEDETPVKRRKQQPRERQVPPKITDRPDPMMDPIIRYNRRLPSPVQSDDEQTLTVDMDDLETFGVTKKPKLKVYENKPDNSFELGFDLTSEEAQQKRKNRAKRFGIEPGPDIIQVDDEKIKSLYESLGIKSVDSSERGIRLEAVHIRGVDNMSTEDVFKYFQQYGPQSIEWIDDSSCNVIWNSSVAAARAMLGTSEDPNGKEDVSEENAKVLKEANEQEPKATENEPEKMEEDDDELNLLSSDEDEKQEKENVIKSDQQKKAVEKTEGSTDQDMDTTTTDKVTDSKDSNSTGKLRSNSNMFKRILPPGNWRIGKAGEKAKFLFMRFANKADHKLPGAERKSQYYKQYGNPNYGGLTGLISSSRKRRIRNHQYQQEVEEARRMVRKTEKYYHGIPEETSFDQHLREAQRARKLKETNRNKHSGDEDGESEEVEEEEGYRDNYKSRRYQNQDNEEEDLEQWGRVSEPEEENKSDNQEEELDLELELGELMKKAPVYRMGRMYADDLEDQMRAKKEAAEELTRQMMRASDARRQIDHNRYKRTHDDRDITLARTLHRSVGRTQSEEDEPSDDDDTGGGQAIVVEDHTRRPRHHHHESHDRDRHQRPRAQANRGGVDHQHRSAPHRRPTGDRDNRATISVTTSSSGRNSGLRSREQVRSAKERLTHAVSSKHSSSRQQQLQQQQRYRTGERNSNLDKRGRRMHRHTNRRDASESDSESSSSQSDDDGSSSGSSSSSSGSSSSSEEEEEQQQQGHSRRGNRANDQDDDDELDLEDEDAILRLNDARKSNFKYEKLRIHVDPDDV